MGATLTGAGWLVDEIPPPLLSPSAAYPQRVLIFGSSNAAGSSASSTATSWAGLLSAALSSTHTITNVAVGGKPIEYWLEQDSAGNTVASGELSNFERLIREYRPHVVLGAFTTQNSIDIANQGVSYLRGFAADFVQKVQKAFAICRRHNVRFVAVTPYNSSAAGSVFTALNRDFNKWIGNEIERLGIDVIDFAPVWGFSGTIPPAAYNSGDGLHLNDAGHAAQYRVIPADVLSLKYERPLGLIRVPSFDGGLTFPADTTTVTPVVSSSFPLGHHSFGVKLKTPASLASVFCPICITGSQGNWRMRNALATGAFTWTVDGTDISMGTLSASTEYDLHFTYDPGANTASVYVNGALTGSGTPAGGIGTPTGLSLGGTSSGAGFNAVGFRFRNLTTHATCLQLEDVRRQYVTGEVSRRSLVGVWPLDDAVTRQAGALFAQSFGGSVYLASSIALA